MDELVIALCEQLGIALKLSKTKSASQVYVLQHGDAQLSNADRLAMSLEEAEAFSHGGGRYGEWHWRWGHWPCAEGCLHISGAVSYLEGGGAVYMTAIRPSDAVYGGYRLHTAGSAPPEAICPGGHHTAGGDI